MAGGSLLAEVRTPRRANGCGVGAFVATLNDADKADLAVVLADRSISVAAIHEALERRGLTLRPNAVRNHRVGGCSCGTR